MTTNYSTLSWKLWFLFLSNRTEFQHS